MIIADLNNDGLVDASDVTLLNSVLAGHSAGTNTDDSRRVCQLRPPAPIRILSLPRRASGRAGGTVVVPVNIDTAHPSGSTGATEAILA